MNQDRQNLPYLTTNIPGIGGTIKNEPEDFQVTEILQYPCSGEGEFLYLQVEKRNIPTFSVVRSLARKLNINEKQISYAGIKDARAVARQYFCLFQINEQDIAALDIPGIEVLSVQRHHKKLKIGNLQGNRFSILIRDVDRDKVHHIADIFSVLKQRGVPNYFGDQRFGRYADTDALGKAFLLQNSEEICDILLDRETEQDPKALTLARSLYRQGKYWDAYHQLPLSFESERALLRALAKGRSRSRAPAFISRKMRYFYISAYQSKLFNRCLARRLPQIDCLWEGDIAMLHPGKSVFIVENAAEELPRCIGKEISPTGPLFGYKVIQPQKQEKTLEDETLQEENLDMALLRSARIKGERRSYRFFLNDVNWELCSLGLWIHFTLPKGCYATVALREIIKSPTVFFLN